MSVELIVEVLTRAPATLNPTERLMLVVIAESCRTESRSTYYRDGWDAEEVARRVGISVESLTKVFRSLAAKGCEVRVPLAVKDGRPVFAFRGRQTTFRLPRFTAECPDEVPVFRERPDEAPGFPQRVDEMPVFPGQRPDEMPGIRAERPDEMPGLSLKDLPSKTFLPSTRDPAHDETAPSTPGKTGTEGRKIPELQHHAYTVIAASLTATNPELNLTHDDIHGTYTEVLLAASQPPKARGYFDTIARNTGFGAYHAAAVRNRNERNQQNRATWRTVLDASPPCGHGEPGGNLISPITGAAGCPKCRRGLPADQTDDTPPHVAAAIAAFGRGWTAGGHGLPDIGVTARLREQVIRYLDAGASPADIALLAELAGKAGTDIDIANGHQQ